MKSGEKSILYVQLGEPAAYPPLIHSAIMLAESGWHAIVLVSPSADKPLFFPEHRNVTVLRLPLRSTHIVRKIDFVRYCVKAAFLGLRIRPAAIYVSDPLGGLPGYVAAKFSGARLVYHEHDSPNQQADLHPVVRKARVLAARAADIVVFPNMQRATAAHEEVTFSTEKLRIVWNVPRTSEVPLSSIKIPGDPLIVYYHGSIVPERLPWSVPAAIAEFGGKAVLRIAGYETEGGRGYVSKLRSHFGRREEGGCIEYVGVVNRDRLLTSAAQTHVGLALVPRETADINMRHMVGASNKAFDYMAAGLPLLVSDLPDWRETFVRSGHAFAVDPNSQTSILKALQYLIEHPNERAEMGHRNKQKILSEWNYDKQFRSVSTQLETGEPVSRGKMLR